MKNPTLLDQYPWYSNHFKAANLMARYFGLEVKSTLEILDKRFKENSIAK